MKSVSDSCLSELKVWDIFLRWSHFLLISLRLFIKGDLHAKRGQTSLLKMPWFNPPLTHTLSLLLFLLLLLQLPTAWSLLLLTKKNPLRLLCSGQLACWSGGRPPTACGCSREYQVQSESIYRCSGPIYDSGTNNNLLIISSFQDFVAPPANRNSVAVVFLVSFIFFLK